MSLARVIARYMEAGKMPAKSPRAPRHFVPRIKKDDTPDDGPVDITEVTKEAASKLALKVAERFKDAVIRKEKGKGFCVKSPNNPDWNGGCYPSKGEAEKRLKQVEYFKHNK